MAAWGLVTFDWADGGGIWQNQHPHMNEAVLLEQCRLVKAEGTGTKCMVYRQNELALQWQEASRAAMVPQNKDWFLQFKTQQLCDDAPPCDVAAFHQCNHAPCPSCNKTAPVRAPNCAYCCNLTSVYNEPIGGQWPSGLEPAKGDNALNDGQLFWDFRNKQVQEYWVSHVALAAVDSDYVDGIFVDDPGGYGQEHPQVQSVVQLTDVDIAALQLGTQQAWNKALALMLPKKKYIYQAFKGALPVPTLTSTRADCASKMKALCSVPTNESAIFYPGPSKTDAAAANLTIAAFLVSRGPFSYISADVGTVESRDWENPAYAILQLDTGKPTGGCEESSSGVFTRSWSGGEASVDCTTHTGMLNFNLRPKD